MVPRKRIKSKKKPGFGKKRKTRPRKRSGKRRKTKKGKGKKGKQPKEGGSELAKEILLIKVETLEEKLERARNDLKESERLRQELQEKYDSLREDLNDILQYQQRMYGVKSQDNDLLVDKVTGLRFTWKEQKYRHETEVTTIKTQFQEEKEKMENEIIALSGKLASLEEFKLQKDEFNNKLTKLKEELKESEEKRENEIYKLDRKYILDKDRLKKDMQFKLQNISRDFRIISNQQMADTTKRALQENVTLAKQAAKLSEENSKLFQTNREVQCYLDQARQHLHLTQEREKQQAMRIQVLNKVIGMLTDKYSQQETFVQELKIYQVELYNLEKEFNEYKLQMATEVAQHTQSTTETRHLERRLNSKDEEIDVIRRDKRRLEHLLTRSARAILAGLSIMEDSTADLAKVRADRSDMFANVLLLLNEADEVSDEVKLIESKRPLPSPEDALALSPVPFFKLRVGDIGLVPQKEPDGFRRPKSCFPLRSVIPPNATVKSAASTSRPTTSHQRPYSHPVKTSRTNL